VRKTLYEGEEFRVVEDTNIPFFRAFSTIEGQRDSFSDCELSMLMATLLKNKPKWAREIDMSGD